MQTLISKILSQIMASKGVTQARLSRETGVGQPTISRILKPDGPKGIKEPTDKQVRPIAGYFGLTTDQLRGHQPAPSGVATVGLESDERLTVVAVGASVGKGDIDIPQYDVRASMGAGQVLPSDYIDTIRRITVSSEFLLEQGVSYTKSGNLAVVTGFGESMNKTFSNGDPLIIDQGVTSVVTDGVYLFTLSGSLFVKRLQRLPSGIRVISDNDSFTPFDVAASDPDNLIIHARVLLAWRSQRL